MGIFVLAEGCSIELFLRRLRARAPTSHLGIDARCRDRGNLLRAGQASLDWPALRSPCRIPNAAAGVFFCCRPPIRNLGRGVGIPHDFILFFCSQVLRLAMGSREPTTTRRIEEIHRIRTERKKASELERNRERFERSERIRKADWQRWQAEWHDGSQRERFRASSPDYVTSYMPRQYCIPSHGTACAAPGSLLPHLIGGPSRSVSLARSQAATSLPWRDCGDHRQPSRFLSPKRSCASDVWYWG